MNIDDTSTRAAKVDKAFVERSVGEIAAQLPGATAVLRRYKFDFCCGGAESLAQAAAAQGIAIEEVEAALRALHSVDNAIPSAKPPVLIDYILQNYHEVHRLQLPELIYLAKRVEAVHRQNPAVPAGLAAMLQKMSEELDAHMLKEERILFPLMRTGRNPMIGQPIARMRQEHEGHGEHIRALKTLTHDCTLPPGACATWEALYAGMQKFIDDLMDHIHLENNVLFPQFAGATLNVPA